MLTLSHATERDVDLLLVEELKCSAEFVRWLAARVLGSVGFAQCEVLHSQRRIQTRREIDIAVQLKSPGARSAYLFIENKLDTAQQFRQ